jgi:tRNA pseudouridine38-40 synthase
MSLSNQKTTYKLIVAYDGTNFSGWQVQQGVESVQGTIEQGILQITQEETRGTGAGRTDAGVHAQGQVAHLHLNKTWQPDTLLKALNGVLSSTIRIRSAEIASDDFHAQKSAIKKEYHYHIILDPVLLPFDRLYTWHYRKRLDISLLKAAAQKFIGTHDFKAFANASGLGNGPKTSIRTLYRLDIVEQKGGFRFEFEGSGFLYKMVRNIVGMIMAVATQRRSLQDIDEVFLSKDRTLAEPSAPPQGLFLMKVMYTDI